MDGEQVANLAKEKLAALTALLKERVGVLERELYHIERQTIDQSDRPSTPP